MSQTLSRTSLIGQRARGWDGLTLRYVCRGPLRKTCDITSSIDGTSSTMRSTTSERISDTTGSWMTFHIQRVVLANVLNHVLNHDLRLRQDRRAKGLFLPPPVYTRHHRAVSHTPNLPGIRRKDH